MVTGALHIETIVSTVHSATPGTYTEVEITFE